MRLKVQLTREEAWALLEYLRQAPIANPLVENAIGKIRVTLRDNLEPGWFEKFLADAEDHRP